MLGQGIGSDEGKCSLNGRFCAGYVRGAVLWHEEGKFPGSYFVGVTGMDSVHCDVCAKCCSNAVEGSRRGMERED